MTRVLGVDLASGCWDDNGTALVAFEEKDGVFTAVRAPAFHWPRRRRLTPHALATTVHTFARRAGVVAVALDGPQGWRDPSTPAGVQGVGRRCDYACRTQGKMGVYPRTFPSTQRGFFEFCVDVFDALLAMPGVALANDAANAALPTSGLVVLECCPTSAWRSSCLRELPGKGKRPALQPWLEALTKTYALPPPRRAPTSHDDLQALMAALCAAGAVGGPVAPLPVGLPAFVPAGQASVSRVEGLIWNVLSRRAVTPVDVEATISTATGRRMTFPRVAGPALRVTQKVIDQVSQGAPSQRQIAARGLPPGTSSKRSVVTVDFRNREYVLVIGDTSAIWFSHQTAETRDAFDDLFATLADEPGEWSPVRVV